MIRALYRAAATLVISMFAAAAIVLAAVLAAVAVVISGCYLALWPPKPKSTSARLMMIFLDRLRDAITGNREDQNG